MTSLPRYILSAILALSLIQSSYARTSTEDLILEESDIHGIQKQETEIKEDSFSEEVQTQKRDYAWIVNVKKGPFPTEKKAKQSAFDLNKILNRTIPDLKNKVSINWEFELPKDKNFSKNKLSWMVNLSLGIYESKNIALQVVQKIKSTQKIPENVFITRELKDSNVSNLIVTTDSTISGEIFFTRELLPEKNKTKEFILVTTNSNSLNVRKNPSSSSSVIGKLLKGSKVPHIGNDNPKKRNDNWFYVEYSKEKFGWISSSYTRKIIESGNSLSTQERLKTSKIKEKPRISQFKKLKPLTTALQSELDIIKADKAKAIQATNQANTKTQEVRLASIKKFKTLKDKSLKQIETLLTKTNFLQSKLNQIKIDKAKSIQATNQANKQVKEERLANIKEFENLKDKSFKQIQGLKITTASLKSELIKFNSDKAKSIQATNQAITKAKEEKLASITEFKNLKDKRSKEIKDLKITTASLKSELNLLKSDKANSIQATNQAITKAKEEKLASVKESRNLKAKNSQQIKNFQTITASLRSELDKTNIDKAKAIKESNQANTKAKKEKIVSSKENNALNKKISSLRIVLDKFKINKEKNIQLTHVTIKNHNKEILASIEEFKNLKNESFKKNQDLKLININLQSDLNKIKADNAKTTTAKNQNILRVKEEKNSLKEKISSLRVVLDKFKINKEKNTQLTNQANTKTKEERLASISKYQDLKEKNSEQIKNLQTITAALHSELDKIESNKAKVIKETNQANTKAKKERLASISKYQDLQEISFKEIQGLKITTATLKSELKKIKTDKNNAIETAGQASAQIQTERLGNSKLITSLKIKNEKEISNLKEKNIKTINDIKNNYLKEIVDLKIFTTSLQSELKKIQVEKEVALNAFDETRAELKTTNLDNIKFTNQLKDTVLFLRKELDNLNIESDKKNKEEKSASFNEIDLIKEARLEKILDLEKTVLSLRSKLDNDKAAKTTKLNKIDQANIKENEMVNESNTSEIKTLNATIKTLRTVLDRFKTEKHKTDKATQSLNSKLGTEKILRDNEISALIKEKTVLKLKLDKINLDRVKAVGRISQRSKQTTTDLITKKDIIDKPAKKQDVVQSNRRLLATDINPTNIVTSNLYNWVKAWESRNTSLYLSFYSKNFKDPKRSLSKWKSYRRNSLKKSSNISIQISNIKKYLSNKNIIRVDFIQRFKSNTTSDVGNKTLVWEKGNDGWKIIKESWDPR